MSLGCHPLARTRALSFASPQVQLPASTRVLPRVARLLFVGHDRQLGIRHSAVVFGAHAGRARRLRLRQLLHECLDVSLRHLEGLELRQRPVVAHLGNHFSERVERHIKTVHTTALSIVGGTPALRKQFLARRAATATAPRRRRLGFGQSDVVGG